MVGCPGLAWVLPVGLGLLASTAASTGGTGPGCQEEATRGEDYMGTMNTTAGNLTCQAWSATEPHSHRKTDVGEHNYCRNPGGRREGVYCLTMDPSTRWQLCPVPLCGTGMKPLMLGIPWQAALLLVPPRPPDYPAPPPGSPAPMDNRSITCMYKDVFSLVWPLLRVSQVEECCCGECGPSLVCSSDSTWQLSDPCLQPTCGGSSCVYKLAQYGVNPSPQ